MKTSADLVRIVENSRKAVEGNNEIETSIGGGLHPSTAAIWAYLLAIQEFHGVGGDLAEIGVFRGWGLFIPSQFCQNDEKLQLFDISPDFLEEAKQFILKRSNISAHQIECRCGDTATMDRLFAEGPVAPRWVHIDGEHSYTAVMHDLNLSAFAAAPDAIIVVDDVDYPHAPSLSRAVFDWVGTGASWHLLFRGFNKAYLASTRSSIPWMRYLNFLPDVLEKYYRTEIMLCSQTKSCESDFYAVSARPQKNIKYLSVGEFHENLADFEGLDPRAALGFGSN